MNNLVRLACTIRDLSPYVALFALALLCGCAPLSLAPGESVKVHPNGYIEDAPPAENGPQNPWAAIGQDIDIRTKAAR